jgi:hypothetical protein
MFVITKGCKGHGPERRACFGSRRQPTWQVVVPKLTLMAAPHCEDDAQRYHELTTAHFAPDFDHRRVTRLRICCLQPSPTWREYGLRQLRFYSIELPIIPTLQPLPSMTATERDLAATVVDHLVDLSQISQQIRQAVASASSTSNRHTTDGRAASRRAAGSLDHDLAPYLIGEWNDELRLDATHHTTQHNVTRTATPATQSAAAPAAVLAHTFAFAGGPRVGSGPPSPPFR